MNSCPAKEDPSTRINDKIMNLISARPPNGLVGLTERLSAKRPQLPEPQPHDLDVSASRESSTAVYSRMSAVSTRPKFAGAHALKCLFASRKPGGLAREPRGLAREPRGLARKLWACITYQHTPSLENERRCGQTT